MRSARTLVWLVKAICGAAVRGRAGRGEMGVGDEVAEHRFARRRLLAQAPRPAAGRRPGPRSAPRPRHSGATRAATSGSGAKRGKRSVSAHRGRSHCDRPRSARSSDRLGAPPPGFAPDRSTRSMAVSSMPLRSALVTRNGRRRIDPAIIADIGMVGVARRRPGRSPDRAGRGSAAGRRCTPGQLRSL